MQQWYRGSGEEPREPVCTLWAPHAWGTLCHSVSFCCSNAVRETAPNSRGSGQQTFHVAHELKGPSGSAAGQGLCSHLLTLTVSLF